MLRTACHRVIYSVLLGRLPRGDPDVPIGVGHCNRPPRFDPTTIRLQISASLSTSLSASRYWRTALHSLPTNGVLPGRASTFSPSGICKEYPKNENANPDDDPIGHSAPSKILLHRRSGQANLLGLHTPRRLYLLLLLGLLQRQALCAGLLFHTLAALFQRSVHGRHGIHRNT